MSSNGRPQDKGVERETRRHPCARTTWCVGFEGHVDPCFEIPREPHAAPDFGPRRSKR